MGSCAGPSQARRARRAAGDFGQVLDTQLSLIWERAPRGACGRCGIPHSKKGPHVPTWRLWSRASIGALALDELSPDAEVQAMWDRTENKMGLLMMSPLIEHMEEDERAIWRNILRGEGYC